MTLLPIPQREFAIYGLSLPRGPNFAPFEEVSWWRDEARRSTGVITFDESSQSFGYLGLRRDVDHRFRALPPGLGLPSSEGALLALQGQLRAGEPPEARPSGEPVRSNLLAVPEGVDTGVTAIVSGQGEAPLAGLLSGCPNGERLARHQAARQLLALGVDPTGQRKALRQISAEQV